MVGFTSFIIALNGPIPTPTPQPTPVISHILSTDGCLPLMSRDKLWEVLKGQYANRTEFDKEFDSMPPITPCPTVTLYPSGALSPQVSPVNVDDKSTWSVKYCVKVGNQMGIAGDNVEFDRLTAQMDQQLTDVPCPPPTVRNSPEFQQKIRDSVMNSNIGSLNSKVQQIQDCLQYGICPP